MKKYFIFDQCNADWEDKDYCKLNSDWTYNQEWHLYGKELTEEEFKESVEYNFNIAIEYGDFEDKNQAESQIRYDLGLYGYFELNGFFYEIVEK